MSNFNKKNRFNKILKGFMTLVFLVICSFLLASANLSLADDKDVTPIPGDLLEMFREDGIVLPPMSVPNSIPSWKGTLLEGKGEFKQSSSETGYYPQKVGNEGYVTCNDQSSGVRNGSKDYEIYYPTVEDYNSVYAYNSASDPALLQHLKDYADKAINEMYDNMEMSFMGTSTKLIRDTSPREYTQSLSIRWFANTLMGELEYADETKPLMMYIQAEITYEDAQNKSFEIAKESLSDKFYELSGEEKPQDLQEGYDLTEGDYPFEIVREGYWFGPQVAVMGDGDNSTYTSFGTATVEATTDSSYNDVMNSYIYSGLYHYNRQNPTGYSIFDIQVANWLHNDNNHNSGGSMDLPHGYIADANGNITSNTTLTQGSGTRGEELYQEARQYYQFLQEVKNAGGYITSVNTEDTQVFASRDEGNRGNDEYIIGPVSITYPYYKNISYMTDIILETSNDDGDSATLTYTNSDFSIILASQGSTQLTGGTTYPGETGVDNENFYIVVNASKAAYPDTINIKAEFEYTNYATATYNILKTPGSSGGPASGVGTTTNSQDGSTNLINVYRYMGGVNRGDFEYKAKCHYTIETTTTTTDTSKYKYINIITKQEVIQTVDVPPDTSGQWIKDGHPTTTTTTKDEYDTEVSVDGFVMQTYVRMDTENKYKKMVQDVAQELVSVNTSTSTITGNSNTYASVKTSEASSEIEFRIKLGGKVWVDGKAGKESNYNGQANDEADTPMSNVRVILHQRKPNGDESVKAETRTDANGDYLFENLNSLYTYYVEFVYNGQYYQPTTYKKDGVSWDNSSKGVDPLTDRQNLNAKFEEIGSYPDNYAGGPVYTRDDLEEAGLIDQFGNPTGSSNQYVNDCMISSYTGYNQGSTFTKEYYPVYNKFLVDEAFNGANRASIVTDSSGKSISTYDLPYMGDYNNLKVNQGYVLREIADMAVQKDVLHTTLEMNDKLPQVYKYNKNNDSEAFDISIRMEDYYYGTHYTRELYKEDYYKPLDTNPETMLDPDDFLKIYVTYKIRLRNQSEVIGTAVQEFVDYYDDEYTLIGSDNTVESEQKYKPYIGERDGTPIEGAIALTTNNESKYGASTQKTINGYNTTYIRTAEEIELQPGEDLYMFITLKVNSVNNLLILDDAEDDRGKANIVEINGYKTYYTEQSIAPNAGSNKTTQEYQDGDIAGLVDVDSIPGNIKTDKIDKNTNFEDVPESVTSSISSSDPNYDVLLNEAKAKWLREEYGLEDDTDKAPSIKIILYNDPNATRTISGNVFEDIRTEDSDLAHIGNGMFDSGEPGVGNVRVDLIDLKETEENGGTEVIAQILNPDTLEWSDATVTTDDSGYYEFRGYIPSNYYVKYTYGIGSEDETIFYNGQDFKSTTYHTPVSDATGDTYLDGMYTVPFDVNNPDTTDYFYNLAQAEADNDAGNRYSDARDLMGDISTEATRLYVNNYSNNSGNGVTNALAQELHDTTPKTYMIAHSGQLNIEIEYDRSDTGTSDTGSDNLGTDNYDKSGYYHLINLDLGLEERPKAQIKMTKQITNVKVVLANQNTLFDASDTATNVMWIDHTAHGPDTENTYETDNNYTNQMMQVPVVRENSSNKGRIQLTMDEELMHGATIQITYAITAANIGEVDYNNNEFYYYGTNTDFDTIVRTTPNTVIDYVGTQVHDADSADDNSSTRNNLQFIADQNPDWSVISIDDIMAEDYLNAGLRDKAELYTTIIKSNALSKDLLPILADQASAVLIDDAFKDDPLNALDVVNASQSVAGVKLVLSQGITSDNSSDDLVYNNMVELVESSNTVGRRMAETVVGNQDPTVEPQEIDADDSQEVTILPPFGQNYIYYVLGIAVAVILIGGIVGVIMVVRKRK